MSVVLSRLLARVVTDPHTGCWLWTGWVESNGYARIYDPAKGRRVGIHRVSYEHFVGPIPVGRQIDHVHERGCRHRHCVNPAHLEAVTPRENTLRGSSPVAAQAVATCCPAGHPYSGSNLYVDPRGWRQCRICTREAGRRYERRRAPIAVRSADDFV